MAAGEAALREHVYGSPTKEPCALCDGGKRRPCKEAKRITGSDDEV
ncbi:MAG TPA: hypothetical protein VN947_18265 [Polyangia bacterium]|nr:hypothetical protein [Polyangia bacterium]